MRMALVYTEHESAGWQQTTHREEQSSHSVRLTMCLSIENSKSMNNWWGRDGIADESASGSKIVNIIMRDMPRSRHPKQSQQQLEKNNKFGLPACKMSNMKSSSIYLLPTISTEDWQWGGGHLAL